MQPVTLNIVGDYWDSFIYKGKLYIWSYSEELTVYYWDDIVDFLIVKYSLDKYIEAINFSFKNGRIFYESYPENRKPFLREQLIYLSQQHLEISNQEIQSFKCISINNPFPELATDIEIFNDVIYGGTDLGLFQVYIEADDNKFEIQKKTKKIWGETEVVRLKANYGGRLALSTGPDGLFEYRVGSFFSIDKDWFQVSKKHSSFADWNFSNIYSSSDEGDSFLALFEKIDSIEKANKAEFNLEVFQSALNNRLTILKQGNILSQKDLFNLNGNTMSWGNGNKIYLWNGDKVLKTDFLQFKVDANALSADVTNNIEIIKLSKNYNQEIISAGVTYFGVIVELEDSLLVIYEDNEKVITYELPSEITKWRAFPRSQRYENQIHIITNNSLKILSFNGDFFNEQSQKQLGMRYMRR